MLLCFLLGLDWTSLYSTVMSSKCKSPLIHFNQLYQQP